MWIYFLYYIGAGYPSWYYPYIIATLLDSVPEECGGTGGDGGSGELSLLNLLDSSNGLGFTGGTGGSSYGYANGQYMIYPGQQSYAQPGMKQAKTGQILILQNFSNSLQFPQT